MPIRLFFSSIHMSFLSNSSAKTDKLNPVIPIPKINKTTDNLKKTIQTPPKNISNLENLLLEQTNTKNSLENNTVLDFANKDFDNTFAQKTKLSAENLSQDIAFKSIFDSSDDLKPFANLNTENSQKNKIFENIPYNTFFSFVRAIHNFYSVIFCYGISLAIYSMRLAKNH